MAVVNPNLQDSPTFDGQAVRDSVDLSAMVGSDAVVVSGMVVSPSSAMVIAIAAGAVSINGTTYNYAGGTATVTAASTSDRRDTVIYTADTGVQVIAGTPCGLLAANWLRTTTSNNPPVKQLTAIPANSVILAEAYVGYSTTTVAAGNLVDKRLLVTGNTQAVIRAGAYQDLAERPGLQGAASIPVGSLASSGATARQGTIDVVIGDSIANGTSAQQGLTDWASVLANTENRLSGQPDPGLSWVFPIGNGAQSGFTTIGTMVAGTGINAGIATPALTGAQSGVIPASTVAADGVTTTGAALTSTVAITAGSTAITVGYQNGISVVGTGIPIGTTVSNPLGTQWLMNQAATATNASLSASFARFFRRVKVYYQTQANGAPITIQPYQAAGATLGASSGSIVTATAGTPAIGVWDSGDLGAGILGDGITITAGAGSAGAVILGVRYYQTAGTGVTVDNLGIGATPSTAWNIVNSPWAQPNWAQYLQHLASQGTPARRLYAMTGINDAGYGGTIATYQATLTAIVAYANAASPLTEVVLVAEHFGDQVDATTLASTTALTAGTGTQTLTCAGVTATAPAVGATISGPGIPTGCVVTAQATRTAGTSVAVTVTGVATVNTAGVYKIANGRGNAARPWADAVAATQTVALATGSTFVNLYERFGDISTQASVAINTTTVGLTTLTATGTNPFSGVLVGQYVYGTGIPNGTKVTGLPTSTTITISQPTIAAATTPTINCANDRFGVSSLADGVHFSDYATSMSGTDGQRAIAEHFINKLAYSRNTPKPIFPGSITQTIVSSAAAVAFSTTGATLTGMTSSALAVGTYMVTGATIISDTGATQWGQIYFTTASGSSAWSTGGNSPMAAGGMIASGSRMTATVQGILTVTVAGTTISLAGIASAVSVTYAGVGAGTVNPSPGMYLNIVKIA